MNKRLAAKWKALAPLAFAGITLWSAGEAAFATVIVRNNQPAATIVVDKNATPQIQDSAKTLQNYIAKSTGATLPISDSAGSGTSLHVGRTPYVVSKKLNLQGLDEEGFVLRQLDNNNFVIAGGSDWGTEFGVYDFLERYLGVRWLMPTELGEDVPRHATIDLPNANVREEPVYLSRRLSPMGLTGAEPMNVWARQNRARGRIEFHHNLLHLFPPGKYFKTNPEFYPTYGGQPYIPIDDEDPRWQPNFSAPGIVDAAVKEIDAYFTKNPNAGSYSLGMNDSNRFDQSPASKARRNGKKNFLGDEDVSNDYFLWANQVVERVLQKHPGKFFGTLAYNNIVEPPTGMKVHPAIIPFITYERMRWADPELRKTGHDLTQSWAKTSPNIGWYDYAYGISYQLPRVWFHQMQEYLSWGAKNGVKHHYAELYPNFGTGPKSWVFTKLLWNPHQNVDALLDDWYRHAAGEAAAPKLKEYYALWEKFWTKDIQNSKWNTKKGQYLDFGGNPTYLDDVPLEYLTRSDRLLNEALTLADTPERKARVAKLQQMWNFYRASVVAYQSMAAPQIQTEAQALQYLDSAATVTAAAQQRRELLAAFEKDPLYSPAYDYITRYDGTQGKHWGQGVLWHLLPWAQKSEPIKNRLRDISRSGTNDAAKNAALLLRVVETPGRQILKNHSFAEGLSGWNIWDKWDELPDIYHKGTFTTGTEYSGDKSSLLVQGLGRGSLMQSVPYQPGVYYAVLNYTLPEHVTRASGTLLLHLLDEKGAVVQIKDAALPSVNVPLKTGGRDSLVVPFELSADAGTAKSARLMLLLDGFGPDKKIYVDEIGLYRLD